MTVAENKKVDEAEVKAEIEAALEAQKTEEAAPAPAPEEAPKPQIVHPAMAPKQRRDRSERVRRTVVRTAKLVNPVATEKYGRDTIVAVPIEPGFNNKGNPRDSQGPVRHYLNKGFVFPHEWNPEKYTFLHCAIGTCFEKVDQSLSDERCPKHEIAWQAGHIRYAV